MSGLLALLAATVVLTGSGTAVGFGIACVAHGNGDANCVLLVLAPVLAGLPLAGALGIWGAAGQGWLGRWRAEEEEGAGAPEQVAAEGGSASVLRQAQDERVESSAAEEEEGANAPEQVAAEGGSASVLRQAQDERVESSAAAAAEEEAGAPEQVAAEGGSASVLRQAQDERVESSAAVEEEGAGASEQVAAEGGSASVLRQAQDERARTEGAGRIRQTHEERVPNEAGPHG